MGRRVEAERVRGVADLLEHADAESALRTFVEFSFETRRVHRTSTTGHGCNERHESALQLFEDQAHIRGLHARFIVVEEDVVGRSRAVEAVDVGELQLHVSTQVGQEGGEVRATPRLDPGLIRQRLSLLDVCDQLRWHAA
jgi:hypothetical protein